ncbi:methyltransferase domain-containing protein [Loktanella sp. F6476L]|uniref:methyltransferase n=1 Tax=Loktanella sp. F6476L TaxID=2926405 RepID=UPI001FF37C88|nr:methyltransferase [Loktanella sp. F6476L]MCK0120555.1 methyltransferase domain-containing protein [Loktanella sp. F6476L]
MADTAFPADKLTTQSGPKTSRWLRLLANPKFQTWAARFPPTRRLVRREGEAMFDIVAGFCHAQILQAVVKFQLPDLLLEQPMPADALACACNVPIERMIVLINGAAALKLVKVRRDGLIGLTSRGAALAGVPGLQGMIAHHDVLYRDLSDPVAFFRGETETELAAFWPYVFGADGATDASVTARYSELMADSQSLVAADTLDVVPLHGVRRLMDVGGGTGAFLSAVGARYGDVNLTLFDLPAVAPFAQDRFEKLGLTGRTRIVSGSFRDDPLPDDADMISLVRVLYDHDDDTVRRLLRVVFAALPAAGRVLISEPMTGGAQPEKAGDAYFALYCMAMRTGRARSSAEIAGLLSDAGFTDVQIPRAKRPFITSAVVAVKPA